MYIFTYVDHSCNIWCSNLHLQDLKVLVFLLKSYLLLRNNQLVDIFYNM